MKILRKPDFAAFLILQCTKKSYFLFQVFLDSQVFLEKGYIFLVNARSEFCLQRNKKNKTFQAQKRRRIKNGQPKKLAGSSTKHLVITTLSFSQYVAIMHPIETCLEKTTIKLKDLQNWSL